MNRRTLLAALPPLALAACATEPSGRATRAVVFFTEDSAALDENAQELVAQMAEQAKARPGAPVRVRGFAAPEAGTARYSRTLSASRARHVADHLIASGIDRSRIIVEPRGAVPYELMAAESRRVEIIVGR